MSQAPLSGTLLGSFELAARQVEIDRQLTARVPALFERKRARMLASPHAFLRGSAPLFYELLAARPELAAGPEGTGWIVGDMHLENVGAYRTDANEVVFALNDFDDTSIAPLRFDVLRLATSVLLAGRSFRCTGVEAVALVEGLVRAYLNAFGGGAAPPVAGAVEELIRVASARSHKELLDDRAPQVKGVRRFVRGERYLDLAPEVHAQVEPLLQAYVKALGDRAPQHAGDWRVDDAAFRVAGTGSLGTTRIALVVREKSGEARLIEFKEARASAVVVACPGTGLARDGEGAPTHAERVVAGARSLLRVAMRHLAPISGLGVSFVARKLFPQEDKLGIDSFHLGAKLAGVVQTIGHLLGAAHARGVTSPATRQWDAADIRGVVDQAVRLAGVFEATYLAYVRVGDRS